MTAAPEERGRRDLLTALAALHLLVSAVAVSPGYLSIDEAIYHLATRDFLATGGTGVLNGYAELRSPELVHGFLSVHDGWLATSYPYLFPALAAPLHAIAGYRALFAVNALAFLGVALLVRALAARLYRDPVLALDAVLLLGLATYAWEYSQAAWPHMTALLFVVGAVHLAVVALQAPGARDRALAAVGAGLVAGLGPGVRIDAAVALPASLAILAFARPTRWREAALALLGAAPGLALLAWTNHLKFGTWNPISYGNDFGDDLLASAAGVVTALCLAASLAWWVSRRPPGWIRRRWRPLAAGVALAAAAAGLATAAGRTWMVRLWALAVDLRTIPADRLAAWVPRTAGGGVVYLGAQKQALLQGLPWLAALPLLAMRPVRREGEGAALAILLLVPAAVLAGYGAWGSDGGLCLNQRLLLPALPFLAILGARLLREFVTWLDGAPGPAAWGVPALAALAGWLALTAWRPPSLDEAERPYLAVPLALAAALAALSVTGALRRDGLGRWLARRAAFGVLVACLSWAGLSALAYQYPRHWQRRAENRAAGAAALAAVPPGSIHFFGEFPDPQLRLMEREGVLLAFPEEDDYRDLPRLLDAALRSGRRAFATLRRERWTELGPALLERYAIEARWDDGGPFVMAELRRR